MYIYKTTNVINGKIYVGMSKYNPEDNPEYLGSGYILKKALKCYGVKNFVKTILEIVYTELAMRERERYWIATLKSQDKTIGYNISEGGDWGDTFTHNPRKEEIRLLYRENTKGEKNPNYGNRWSKEQRERASKKAIKNKIWIDKRTGKAYSQGANAIKKASEAKMGLKNPCANLWRLISPVGDEFMIEGGIKRNIKKFGMDFQSFRLPTNKNKNASGKLLEDGGIQNKKGWVLYKLPKP